MREKVFRNSSGFRFNVSFVDCSSVFIKSVLETSLSFTYINLIIFLTIFYFSIFVCTLKYVDMIMISNIFFFRFCWKNEKLDWPKCARTPMIVIKKGVFICQWTRKNWSRFRVVLIKEMWQGGNMNAFRPQSD